MRQEFERHRFVTQISVVDMLLFQSHAEYQVRWTPLFDERLGIYQRRGRNGILDTWEDPHYIVQDWLLGRLQWESYVEISANP